MLVASGSDGIQFYVFANLARLGLYMDNLNRDYVEYDEPGFVLLMLFNIVFITGSSSTFLQGLSLETPRLYEPTP